MQGNLISDCTEKQLTKNYTYFIFTLLSHVNLTLSSTMLVKYCNRWQNHFLFEFSIGKFTFDNFSSALHVKKMVSKNREQSKCKYDVSKNVFLNYYKTHD